MAAKYRVRSISLPSRSHPITVRVEEELGRLQSCESTSFASTSDSICRGLSGLEELLMHKGVVACESQADNGHELDGVDSALSSLFKSAEAEKIQSAFKKLRGFGSLH